MTDEVKQTCPPTHQPTKAQRDLVKLHAMVGTRQDVISDIIGIDPKTLRKHYREELDQSTAKANATIGGALFNKARSGDTAAMLFWMKTRAGWKETNVTDHTSSDGSMATKATLDTSKLSDDQLSALLDARIHDPN